MNTIAIQRQSMRTCFKVTQALNSTLALTGLSRDIETDKLQHIASFKNYIDNSPVPSGVLPYVFSLLVSSEGDCILSSWSLFGSFGLRSRRPFSSIGLRSRRPSSSISSTLCVFKRNHDKVDRYDFLIFLIRINFRRGFGCSKLQRREERLGQRD